MRVPATREVIFYLEGVRCSLNSATISVRANNPATAEISVPPVIEVKNILPRTLVHLFYRDPELADPKKANDESESFRLLFEGEVVGVSFSKDATGNRSATIHCMDLSNYFFYNYALYFSGSQRGSLGLQQMIFSGDEDITQRRANSLGSEVNKKNPTVPDLKFGSATIPALLSTLSEDGIVSAIQEIFRIAQDNNEFFRLANRRLRISDVLDPPPSPGTLPQTSDRDGQPLLGLTPKSGGNGRRGKIIALKDPESVLLFAGDLLDGRDSRVKSMTTYLQGQFPSRYRLTEVMDKLMNAFYYQYWSIPTSSAVDQESSLEGDDGYRINSFIIKPPTFYTAPPACNVLFPDLYTSFSASRMFLEEPTRLLLRTPPGGISGISAQHAFLAPGSLNNAVTQLISRPVKIDAQEASPTPFQIQTPLNLPGFLFSDSDISDKPGTPLTYLYRVLMASKTLPEESREDIKGLIDREIQLPMQVFAAALLNIERKPDPDNPGNIVSTPSGRLAFQQYLVNVANFELLLAQHAPREITVVGPFNPYIVPGLPFAVLDEVNPVIADAGSVTWSVSADGFGTTTISGIYARERDILKTVLFPSGTPRVGLDPSLANAPFFAPFSYHPQIVGRFQTQVTTHRSNDDKTVSLFKGETRTVLGAYPQLFGEHRLNNGDKVLMKSMIQPYSGVMPDDYKFLQFGTKENPGAIRRALSENRSISDEEVRANKAWEYVRRNIASLRQVFEYINAKVTNIELIENNAPPVTEVGVKDIPGPFRDEFRAAAKSFRASATPGRVGVTIGAEIGKGVLAT